MSQHSPSKKPNWQSAVAAKTAYSAANIVSTDQGWVDSRTGEVLVACRMMKSKGETPAGDAAGVPTFAVKRISKAGNFSCAKGQAIRLVLTPSEAVTVTGTPTIELVLAGTAGTRSMSFVVSKSSSSELVFDYELVAGDVTENLGQIVSIANTWVGGTVTDLKSDGTAGTAVSPQTFTVPSVTGIIVTA